MKCINPECNEEVKGRRKERGFLTCCKKCSNAYGVLNSKIRRALKDENSALC